MQVYTATGLGLGLRLAAAGCLPPPSQSTVNVLKRSEPVWGGIGGAWGHEDDSRTEADRADHASR